MVRTKWYLRLQVLIQHSLMVTAFDPYAIAGPHADIIVRLEVIQRVHVSYTTQLRKAHKVPTVVLLKRDGRARRFHRIPCGSKFSAGEREDRPVTSIGQGDETSFKNCCILKAVVANTKPALVENAVTSRCFDSYEAKAHVVQLRYGSAEEYASVARHHLVVVNEYILAYATAAVVVVKGWSFGGDNLLSRTIHETRPLITYERDEHSGVEVSDTPEGIGSEGEGALQECASLKSKMIQNVSSLARRRT